MYDSRGLLGHEKAAIREELRVFARAHPARVPFSIRVLESLEHAIYSPRLQFATAALALVLVTGSGTAFAAQSALPGDALYGVKVNIEEPIMGSFATSPEAQANWNAQLAATRLSEAEQLAAQNKLTPAAAATIASGLNQATDNFDTSVAQIATSSDNAAIVATLASNMEATLSANTQVMSQIASSAPDTAATLQPILSSAQERTASLNIEVQAAQDASTSTQIAIDAGTGLSTTSTSTASVVAIESDDATTSSASSTDSGDATSTLRSDHAKVLRAHL